ncbi:MAG: hypothetical protein ACK4R9_11560 [Ignavibacterium sp.]
MINLDKEKKILIDWITQLNDESVIERIKMLKENLTFTDWWEEISDEERASIERGLEDAQKGRVTSHDKVKKNYETWL